MRSRFLKCSSAAAAVTPFIASSDSLILWSTLSSLSRPERVVGGTSSTFARCEGRAPLFGAVSAFAPFPRFAVFFEAGDFFAAGLAFAEAGAFFDAGAFAVFLAVRFLAVFFAAVFFAAFLAPRFLAVFFAA